MKKKKWFQRLSENYSFALYTSNDDSSFWNCAHLVKKLVLLKNTNKQIESFIESNLGHK